MDDVSVAKLLWPKIFIIQYITNIFFTEIISCVGCWDRAGTFATSALASAVIDALINRLDLIPNGKKERKKERIFIYLLHATIIYYMTSSMA